MKLTERELARIREASDYLSDEEIEEIEQEVVRSKKREEAAEELRAIFERALGRQEQDSKTTPGESWLEQYVKGRE